MTETTKDIFIFACYIGLSYMDVKNHIPENLVTGINGKDWICCRRKRVKPYDDTFTGEGAGYIAEIPESSFRILTSLIH